MYFHARVAQWQRNRLVIGRLAGSNPLSGWAGPVETARGGVPEWLIGTDCKSVALRATQVRILPPPLAWTERYNSV